jgi:hypothetical protein
VPSGNEEAHARIGCMSMSSSSVTWPVRFADWSPTSRDLRLILGAFLLGLLLFLIVVVAGRQHRDAPVIAPTMSLSDDAPLPTPLPAGAAGASGLEEPDEETSAERPRIVEAPRPVASPAPAPTAPVDSRASAIASVPAVPISSPPPRYPQRAMQRRETGMVRVEVQVGADGSPVDVREV